MHKAECRTALEVPGAAAGQQAAIPVRSGLLPQQYLMLDLLRLGLQQGLCLCIRHDFWDLYVVVYRRASWTVQPFARTVRASLGSWMKTGAECIHLKTTSSCRGR